MNVKDVWPASPERRSFLKQTAGAGLAVGAAPLLLSCGGGGDVAAPATPAANTETRTYYFDLSHADPSASYFLVAGNHHHPLRRLAADEVSRVQASNTVLQAISSGNITHVGSDMPLATTMQMCYLKGKSAAMARGEWKMHAMFYHLPSAHAAVGAQRAQACGKDAPASLRAAYAACIGAGTAPAAALKAAATQPFCGDPQFDAYKDFIDQAVAMVCHHPEIGSFDGPTLAYIQQAIICADQEVLALAVSLYKQSQNGGAWATQIPVMDDSVPPQQKLASNGDKLYYIQHTTTTQVAAGAAIRSVMPKIKNDPTLGGDITALPRGTANTALQGKNWVTRTGATNSVAAVPSAARQAGARVLAAAGGSSWTHRDITAQSGFSVNTVSGSGRAVTFTVENWYLRYLGLYIRFLDGNGQPIALSDVDATTMGQFPTSLNGTYDAFLDLVNQELVLLGIPVKEDSNVYTVTLPANAASIQILASGLGSGTNTFSDTTTPGAAMTVVLDMAVPGLFLVMAAVQGYAQLSTTLSTSTELLLGVAKTIVQAMADASVGGLYRDSAVFLNLVQPVAITLLKSSAALYGLITTDVGAGEAEGALEDAAPFGIGIVIQAVMAAATVVQIGETSAEVANAPWTYVNRIDATHDLTLTINHDPADTQGFPATATSYQVIAACDGASPVDSGLIALPATTQTAPLTYVIPSLPFGGMVSIKVAFYSANGWLAGAGAVGPVSNAVDTAAVTIKENLVPLTATTLYSHKQKLGLDASGNHVWKASLPPPVQVAGCSNASGNLCELTGITVSETYGAVGYTWKSFSTGVTAYGNGATGQLHQFANISFTQTPQAGFLHSSGFPAPPRLAYTRSSPTAQNFYIDTSSGGSIVRQLHMTAVDTVPTFDSPSSNLAVGSFNFASDAFLIHPNGNLISLNAELNKFEVLVPSATPQADSLAPVAQAYSGPGLRPGLMNAPVCATITPLGAVLVLEAGNNRVQAFDTGANPTAAFGTLSTMPLKAVGNGTVYYDMSVDIKGYLYLLSFDVGTAKYNLDIYTPDGTLLCTTPNLGAARLTVDLFRNVFTLNYETIVPVGALTEPSVSMWIPSTPTGS